MVKVVDEKDFDGVRGDEIALVDFSATWCGPCQMLHPVLEAVSENSGFSKVKFYQLDVDQCPNLSREFGVVSIPFLVILKKGQVAATNVGFVPQKMVEDFISKNI